MLALPKHDVKRYLQVVNTWSTLDFRRLWAAQSVSALGSQVTVLALPLVAASTLDAGPVALGVLTAASTAAYVPLALPVGVWVDRAQRRRRLLIGADLLAAAALLILPVGLALGVLSVPLLAVSALIVGACQVLHRTAFAAHLPDVVPDSGLMIANSRFRATDSGAQIVGPGAAGGLVAVVGPVAAIVVDAVSFLLSAGFLARMKTDERLPPTPSTRQPFWCEISEGAGTVWADRRLRAIAGAAANLNFAGTASFALLVLFATRELRLSPLVLGLVLSAGGVGALLGALSAPHLTERWGPGRTVVAASAGFSLCLAAVPLAAGPKWLAASVLIVGELLGGFAVMVFDTTTGALVAISAPRLLLGRVWATLGFLTQSAKPLGALLGGVLGQQLGLRPALVVSAGLAATSVAWTFFSPLRQDGSAQGGDRVDSEAEEATRAG